MPKSAKLTNTFALIMAGGSGTRFWPRSRKKHPKQLLDIVAPEAMIQSTVRRVIPLLEWEQILICCGADHARTVRTLLPRVPAANLIMEPEGKNTAPCVAVAAEWIRQNHRADSVMMVLPCDHVVSKPDVLRKALSAAVEVAARSWELITFGIRPRYAETGYGYVQKGEPVESSFFRVKRFAEKPSQEIARQYVHSGEYLWNSGMFVWRVDAILNAIEDHLPKMYAQLRRLGTRVGTRAAALRDFYRRCDNVSIDIGVMEKSVHTLVLATDPGWNDVGSWSALYDVLPLDQTGSIAEGPWINVSSSGVLINSPKLVATVGVRDLIIIETADALLVCDRSRAQEVKQVVEELKRRGMRKYL